MLHQVADDFHGSLPSGGVVRSFLLYVVCVCGGTEGGRRKKRRTVSATGSNVATAWRTAACWFPIATLSINSFQVETSSTICLAVSNALLVTCLIDPAYLST